MFDMLLSKPTGVALGFFYVAQTALPDVSVGSPVVNLIVQLGVPVGLVAYFLIRDERREKTAERAAKKERELNEAKERATEERAAAKEAAAEERIKNREADMVKRIQHLENYINEKMMGVVIENNECMRGLTGELHTFIDVLSKKECPFGTKE